MHSSGLKRIGWGVLLTLSLVGLLITTAHYAFRPSVEEAIAGGFGPSPAWYLEQLPRYDDHALATFLHLAPAFLFMLLAPLQLVTRLRTKYPAVHRVVGRILIALSLPIAATAVVLGVAIPFGGLLETAVSLSIATGFLVSLGLGVRSIRRKQVTRHRFWMSHMLAFAYTPLTMRLLLPIATEAAGLDGQAVFSESMLVACVMNLLVLHWWLRRYPHPVTTQSAARSENLRHTTASDPATD